ncbi:MAG: hypothetical protein GY769_25560 [bacterium]|nr:hypothetical protein [bacterium]
MLSAVSKMAHPEPANRAAERFARLPTWVDIAVIATTLAVMLGLTWKKWPDPMVDFGRELYVPWQLSLGKVLYADIAYFNGPLSPYFNALVFKLFGVSFMALSLANLVLLGATVFLVYRLLSAAASRLGALTGTLLFVVLFATSKLSWDSGNYNYVSPYSHEMTHGILLCLVALSLLAAYFKRGRTIHVAGIGLALGLTFLTKAEFFIALAPALLLGLIGEIWLRRKPAASLLRPLGGLIGFALLPPALAFALLSGAAGAAQAWRGTLGTWPHLFARDVLDLPFYRSGMGMDRPLENLHVLLEVAGGYLILLGPLTALALLLRRPLKPAAWAAIGAGLIALALPLGWWLERHLLNLARPLPLVIALICLAQLAIVAGQRRCRDPDRRWLLALCLSVFSLTLLLKIFLNVRVYHYGFVLAMPATLVLVCALVDWVPTWLRSKGGSDKLFAAAMLGLLAATAFAYVRASTANYRPVIHSVGEGADAFLADRRGPVVRSVLERLNVLIEPGATLAVLPEGVMLNYLSSTENPTPFINFMPPEVLLFGEDRMLEAFRGQPPDYIVLTNRGAREYGFRLIGVDYAVQLMAWIEANYDLIDKVHDVEHQGDSFSLALILRARS